MPVIVMNQMTHQESGTSNLQEINSNPGPPPPKSPVVSAIMGRLNYHTIDSGDVEVKPSNFPVESNSESVTDPNTNLIKSIDDDEMEHLM